MAATQITAEVFKGGDAEIANVSVSGTLDVTGVTTFTGAAAFAGGTTQSAAQVRNALTALAGGAQAGTALSTQWNRFTTVASAADSAQLPAATVGLSRIVKNAAAANSMNVFPATGEAINALANNTAFAVAAGKQCEFRCFVAGKWDSLLTA